MEAPSSDQQEQSDSHWGGGGWGGEVGEEGEGRAFAAGTEAYHEKSPLEQQRVKFVPLSPVRSSKTAAGCWTLI